MENDLSLVQQTKVLLNYLFMILLQFCSNTCSSLSDMIFEISFGISIIIRLCINKLIFSDYNRNSTENQKQCFPLTIPEVMQVVSCFQII